jgi:NDP-4-keto-2,6-dideoxyhexose 3-C-methyltransferase
VEYVATHTVLDDVPEALKRRYPLRLVRCSSADGCGLVQLGDTVDQSLLYYDYGYRSGINQTMRTHLAGIVDEVTSYVPVTGHDLVLDIGCNDGTLLAAYAGPERLGFEPSANVAEAARARGIDLVPDYFNKEAFAKARPGRKAKIITSIAMFYDLPDPLRFVEDIAAVLAPDGIWALEMSYIGSMLDRCSYDTVCHEHLEYYAFRQIEWLFERAGLRAERVSFNDINGGSFRVLARHAAFETDTECVSLEKLRGAEHERKLDTDVPYAAFRKAVEQSREELKQLLADLKRQGKRVYAYGASTKGNIILQYCGIDHHLVPKAADRNPEKWGRRTPGTGIEIVSEAQAREEKPDYFLVLPWHFLPEFAQREREFLDGGGQFILPLPSVRVVGKEGR